MSKYILQSKPTSIDMGDGQTLYIKKLGFAKYITILKNHEGVINEDQAPSFEYTEKTIILYSKILEEAVIDWKGFIDEENKEVEFSIENLINLVYTLPPDNFATFMNIIIPAILPETKKILEKQDKNLKNLKTVSSKSK